MARTTEIYTCRPGQDIKQGKLEISAEVTTREAAMADAFKRSQADPSLGTIAYYSVGDEGDVETLFTYEGSKTPERTKRPAPAGGRAGIPKGPRKKAAKKLSLFGRLRSVFEA